MRRIVVCAAALMVMSAGLFGADVYCGAVVKSVDYWQSGPTTQSYDGATPYTFIAIAPETSNSPDSLVSGNLKSGATVLGTFGPPNCQWTQKFASAAAMDAAYPNGNYTLSITGLNDGTHSSTLGIGSTSYLSVPLVSNYNALQAIDATQPFTINWGAISGAQGLDSFMLQIRTIDIEGWGTDEVLYATPWPGQPGALNYLATSVTVPAGVLAPGNSYEMSLMMVHMDSVDLAAYPGVPLVTGYANWDHMRIQTIPEPATLTLLTIGGLALLRRRSR